MTEHQPPRYIPPTADELRFLIKKYWQEHRDPSKRAKANDHEFLNRKVRETQQLLRDLVRRGMQPHDAEIQAMREVALAE